MSAINDTWAEQFLDTVRVARDAERVGGAYTVDKSKDEIIAGTMRIEEIEQEIGDHVRYVARAIADLKDGHDNSAANDLGWVQLALLTFQDEARDCAYIMRNAVPRPPAPVYSPTYVVTTHEDGKQTLKRRITPAMARGINAAKKMMADLAGVAADDSYAFGPAGVVIEDWLDDVDEDADSRSYRVGFCIGLGTYLLPASIGCTVDVAEFEPLQALCGHGFVLQERDSPADAIATQGKPENEVDQYRKAFEGVLE